MFYDFFHRALQRDYTLGLEDYRFFSFHDTDKWMDEWVYDLCTH